MSPREDGLDRAAKDWNDAYVQGFDALKVADTEWSRAGEYRGGAPALKPISLRQFLEMELKPRASILGGLLHECGIIMMFAWRGIGKTWFALNLAYAIAVAGHFLRWKAEKHRWFPVRRSTLSKCSRTVVRWIERPHAMNEKATAMTFDPLEFIGTEAAKRRAGVAQRTIREWCALHKIGRRIAGRWRVSQIALDMWLEGDHESLDAYIAGDRSSDRVRAYYGRRGITLPATVGNRSTR